ncbi:unnamed protein product, partial [Meganyctiphanes norvegica]
MRGNKNKTGMFPMICWRPIILTPGMRTLLPNPMYTVYIGKKTTPYSYKSTIHPLKSHRRIPESIIQVLEVDQTYLIPMDSEKQEMLSVTPLDANHVPGAVMFLFQGYFGNILYCGDMRWYEDLLENPILRSVVEAKELDIVYIDNTFCADYCVFPSREGATKQIFDIIDSYPDHVIKIGVRSLGREDLLVAVGKHYQERVLVSPDKYKMLQMLGYPDVFTTEKSESRIHTIDLRQINNRNHSNWNCEFPTISIVITALFVGWPNGPYSSQAERGVFVVPYSDHSSYAELEEMVRVLAPRRLIPIVTQWSRSGWWSDPHAPNQSIKANMEVFQDLLTYPPPEPFEVPDGVHRAMSSGASMHTMQNPKKVGMKCGLILRPPKRSAVRGVHFTSPDKSNNSRCSMTETQSVISQIDLSSMDPICVSTPLNSPKRCSVPLRDTRNDYSDTAQQSSKGTSNNVEEAVPTLTLDKLSSFSSKKSVDLTDEHKSQLIDGNIRKVYLLKHAIFKASYNLAELDENQKISEITKNGQELCGLLRKYIEL